MNDLNRIDIFLKMIADLQAENSRMKEFLNEYGLIGAWGELIAPKVQAPTAEAPKTTPKSQKYGISV